MRSPEIFPFQLEDIFFIRLEFARQPEFPKGRQIQIIAKIKAIPKNDQGKLQVNLLITTDKKSPFKAIMETVSLFDYLVDDLETDKDLITNFINSQVILLLWTQCLSQMRIITSSMGIEPLHLNIPQGISIGKDQIFPSTKATQPEESINKETSQ